MSQEERRIVTVLFADVTGSTAMGEAMDPEEVRALLGRYYEIAKGVVSEHGGTLEKFIGDAVMAVFGLPSAHGDDAERAIAAALALRDEVRADQRLGHRLAVRFGVGTGEVVAARDPSAGDFLVTGDAVNVAARLQQSAEPWQVLVTQRTAHAAAGRFEFGGERQVDAKGKSTPITAREAIGRQDAPGGLPQRPPLVGREADLEQLQLVARRAFSERRPSLVSLIAPAGTGKTRLLEEFLDWLADFRPDARVATAQCLPYGQQLTYWPMRQILFTLAAASEDASPAELLAAVQAWLLDIGANPGAAELLAATIGMSETELLNPSELFGAWREAIEAASRAAPLVVVFEDLHWSSDSLLDLFEYLMQPRGEAPILMLALTRPELLDRRPNWGGGRRNHLAVSLEPLSDSAVAELVGHLLETDSPELVTSVIERAEGNPFYAGELVRSAIEQGGVDKLPDTVQATVLARLDLLPGRERRALQLGSVFGRSFRVAGVAALERGITDWSEVVERLALRDLVRPNDGDRYTFRHILIREVAYGTLPRVERSRLHAAAADWHAARAEGRESAVAEIIALHYREAATIATSTDPEARATFELREKAVAWLERALDAAAAVEAHPEAVRHARAALELARPEQRARLFERLGDMVGGDGAVEAYAMASKLYADAGAPAGDQLRVLAGRLMVETRFQGSVANRVSLAAMNGLRTEGEALAAQTDDSAATARFLVADGFFPFWLSAEASAKIIAAGERSAQEGYRLAADLGDTNLMSAALDAIGGAVQLKGEWLKVREFSARRLELKGLSLYERLDAYSMVAWASCLLGELGEADRASAAGIALVRPGQAPAPVLHALAWRLYALCMIGEWDEVQRVAARAAATWVDTGRLAAGYALRGFIPALDVARARRDEAQLRLIGEIVDEIVGRYAANNAYQTLRGYGRTAPVGLPRQFGDKHFYLVEIIERKLNLAADLGREEDPSVVAAVLAKAEGQYPLLEAQCRRSMGLQQRDAGELRKAEALWRGMGAAPYVARVQHEIGRLIGDGDALAGGRAELERLGDVDYLDRFDTART
ncbi:MAG: AAA family ATPase [Candidatus Dormibacteraeota bacterium]|nr:AAA family ATPase [Candidatus Dormibacteraeota bacterium]